MFGNKNVGTVAFKITSNKGAFTKEMISAANSAESAFSPSMKKIGSMISTAFTVSAVSSFSKECIELGSNLSEVQNVVDITFGEGAKEIDSWARTTSTAFGISELSAKQYSGTMGAMLKSMGLAADSARSMSIDITELAGDMASFYNLDTDTAFEKIRAGISGETEPLKQLGINMSVANLEAFALSQGITTAYSKMSQADQALVRYNYLMSATASAQGDFARTSDSWANQVRILSLNFDSLKSSIGQLMINALTPLIVQLNQVLAYINQIVSTLSEKLGGKSVSETSVSMSGLSSSAADAASSILGTGDAAEKAAKKARKAFAAYDEINVLNKSENTNKKGSDLSGMLPSSATSSTAGGGGSSGFDTSELENILAKVTAIASGASLAVGAILAFTGVNIPLGIALMAVGAVGLAAAIALNWNAMDKSVTGAIDVVGTALSAGAMVIGAILAFTGVNIPIGVALLAIGAVGMATAAALNWNSMDNNCKTVVTTIMSVIGGAALAIGAILAFSGVNIPLGIGLMAAGAVAVGSAIAVNWKSCDDKISTTLTTIGMVVSGALLAIGAVLAFSGANIPLGIALIAAGAVGIAATVAVKWNGISDKVKNTLSIISAVASGALLAIGTIITLTSFNPALGLGLIAAGAVGLVATVAVNWNNMPDSVRKTVTTIGAIAGTALLALGLLMVISGVAIPMGLGLLVAGGASLATAIAPNWDYISEKIKEQVTKIKSFFNGLPDFFNNLWAKIKEKFTSIGTKIGDAMGSAFKKAVNAVMRTIENVVNTPIKAINSLIGVINKVPGINLGTLKTFSLPRLAQGGWVAANNPRLAVIGDNRREGEIVTPESKIREQVELAFAKAREIYGNAVQTVKLQLELLIRYPDGREVIKQINEAQIKEGKILLEI